MQKNIRPPPPPPPPRLRGLTRADSIKNPNNELANRTFDPSPTEFVAGRLVAPGGSRSAVVSQQPDEDEHDGSKLEADDINDGEFIDDDDDESDDDDDDEETEDEDDEDDEDKDDDDDNEDDDEFDDVESYAC